MLIDGIVFSYAMIAKAQFTADFLKALAHPTRLAILDTLRGGEKCVCKILPELGLEQPNVSQHLAKMRERGILEFRKEGNSIYYSVRDHRIYDVLEIIRGIIVREMEKTNAFVEEIKKEM
jgi:ArsR family transcriptional regulator